MQTLSNLAQSCSDLHQGYKQECPSHTHLGLLLSVAKDCTQMLRELGQDASIADHVLIYADEIRQVTALVALSKLRMFSYMQGIK